MMKKFLFPALLAVISVCPRDARAQDIGNVGFRTVNQPIFLNQTVAAVSPAQNPLTGCAPVAGTPCAVPNLGQNGHSVTYSISSPCTTGFSMTMRLEATQNGSTWFAISEDATDQNSGTVQGSTTAGLTAQGLYAGYRLNLVQIACASGQTPAVTATYSGTFNATPTAIGAFYQSSPYRKVLFQNQPTTVAPNPITINAATGNSSGAVFVNCFVAATGATTNCPSGLSITLIDYIAFGGVTGGGGGGNIIGGVSTFLIPTSANAFIFPVSSNPAVSTTFTFAATGAAGTNWSAYYVANSNPLSQYVTDPCQSAGASKSTVAVNISTATTTQLVTLLAGSRIYTCSASLTIAPTGTSADTATIETGSGASCGTGTIALTGALGAGDLTTAAPPLFVSLGELQATPTSNALCLVSAGTTVNIQGYVTYVQQ